MTEYHVWLNRSNDGRRNDYLKVGDTDNLADHAPAWVGSDGVEYVGTFEDFAAKRDQMDITLSSRQAADADIVHDIGRQRFWDVVYNREAGYAQ